MVAGLMTTAVLAGLTLGNVNTTEAHAATNNAPVAAQKAPATSAEIQSQQVVVNSASAAVNSQTAVVSNAQAALSSAQSLNSASNAVSNAEAQWSQAQKSAKAAQTALGSASTKSQKAASELKGATNLQHGFWKKSGSAAYDYLTGLVSDNQKALDEAQAKLPAASAAWSAANDARIAAVKKGMDKNSAEYKALVTNAEDAYNDFNAINNAITSAKNTIASANDKLNGKLALAEGNKHNLVQNKALIDSIPSLQQAAQSAHDAYVQASNAASDAETIAKNASDNISAVRNANNLPDSAVLKKMGQDAYNAHRKIQEDKDSINGLSAKVVRQASANGVKLTQAQNAVAKAKADVATYANGLTKAEDNLTAAQKAYDAHKSALNDKLLANAKQAVQTWQGLVDGANAALKAANDKLARQQRVADYWNGKVKAVQASQRYQQLSADIVYRQSLIDNYNAAKKNVADAANAAASVAHLQAAYDQANNTLTALKNTLAREQAKLAAMEGQTPSDNGNQSSNTGNQGNQGNAGNQNQGNAGNQNHGTNNEDNKTANAGHNSNATVKTSQKSVAVTSAKAATKKNAATTAKAKKLPQTGNDSAAVVALGALSGMLGLGLAAKKREF